MANYPEQNWRKGKRQLRIKRKSEQTATNKGHKTRAPFSSFFFSFLMTEAKDTYSQFCIIIDTFFYERTKICSLHKKN